MYVSRIRIPQAQTPEDYRFGLSLLNLFEWVQDPNDLCSAGQESRRKERRQLARLMKWSGLTQLLHPCPPGCCSSEAEAKNKVWESINAVFFGKRPGTPAKNKWTQLHPTFSWFLLLLSLPGLAVYEFLGLLKPKDKNANNQDSNQTHVSMEEVLGGNNGSLHSTGTQAFQGPGFASAPPPVQ